MTDTLTYSAQVEETQRWLTKAEAAKRLRVTQRTIDRYRRAGLLQAYKPAGSRVVRFKPEDVDALMEAK